MMEDCGTLSDHVVQLVLRRSTILKEVSTLKVWKADASGNIKQTDKTEAGKCDVGTDLDVLNALKRRGVAYEIARVMRFEVHEIIVNLLFKELQRDPPDGFRRVIAWLKWHQQKVRLT